MSNRKHTPEENAAKSQAKTIFFRLGQNFKSVIINGIKITNCAGSLKTDWQIEEEKRRIEAEETARKKRLAEKALGALSGFDVDLLELVDGIVLENQGGKLAVVDTE
ncbi:hypothetical protein SAMN02746065_10917 [Desulfocicer vacuolatum DSM 3385]|uniref:Uncharacterized protein n=1 Tax=Desulfocicer vacuolatum DSM 3385 TaxID=1121400 RepID=A0A1W2BP01_9BACT|nr:hypothetical protein [Desulfocicer vacuolatum]SMC74630.1 hypothetical protein SAMN02746065_10917 [Desulfocicer vacuolatum DSM 3385]